MWVVVMLKSLQSCTFFCWKCMKLTIFLHWGLWGNRWTYNYAEYKDKRYTHWSKRNTSPEQSKAKDKINTNLNTLYTIFISEACMHTFSNTTVLVSEDASPKWRVAFRKLTFASNPRVKAFTKSAPFCRALAFFVSGLVWNGQIIE